jgi:hypothetical protein
VTLTSFVFLLFVGAGIAGLWTKATREHRSTLRQRSRLLNPAATLLGNAAIAIGDDSFPVLTGRLSDKRKIRIEVIADTLVCRRLPQLWMKLTISELSERPRPSIGILARPTGAEFYSLVHDLPDRIEPPFQAELPLLMRGHNASPADVERVGKIFRNLLRDPTVKEALVTPRGVRLIRQIAQGEHGAHMVYRQIRFPLAAVSPELLCTSIADAEMISGALDETATQSPRKVA